MDQILTVFVDGIIYSSWLFIAAIGLTLIYGVMKIVNLTHGSFYALGAYAGASFTGAWIARGYPPMLSYAVLLASAVIITLVFAPLIERGILRFMYAKDEVVIMLITYALFLILEDVIKLVWGVDPYFIAEPYGLLGSFEIGDLSYPTYNLILVGIAIASGAGLTLLLQATRVGKLLRTVIQEAAPHLNEQVIEAAKAAAAIMGMNNIFYRFRHLSSNPKYPTMPARLRM